MSEETKENNANQTHITTAAKRESLLAKRAQRRFICFRRSERLQTNGCAHKRAKSPFVSEIEVSVKVSDGENQAIWIIN